MDIDGKTYSIELVANFVYMHRSLFEASNVHVSWPDRDYKVYTCMLS